MKETKTEYGTVITFTKKEMNDMYRRIAERQGVSLRQYKALLKKEKEHWCSCKSDAIEAGNIRFCDDGQRINEHCCSKHHYHCGNCGKITQVG